jgi:hypothetical protein
LAALTRKPQLLAVSKYSAFIVDSGSGHHLVGNKQVAEKNVTRIDPDKTEDILMGTKVSLTTGDELKVKAPVDNAFSVIATITQDVLT